MKISFIGYATNQGITVIAHSIADNIDGDNFLVVSHPHNRKSSSQYLKSHYFKVPVVHPSIEDFNNFFDKVKPDVHIMVETPFNADSIDVAKRRGIKTVFYPMIERFPRQHPVWQKVANECDLIACPTKQSFDYFSNYYPTKTVHLQYPIDIKIFKFVERKICKTFIHNAGFMGVAARKGTNEVIKAFSMIKNDEAKLVINSQVGINTLPAVTRELIEKDKRINFRLFDTDDLNLLYKDGDVAVQPSKFEGIGLTVPESMACGLPTITTDAPPMNEFVNDDELLVEVESRISASSPNKEIDGYKINIDDLKQKMEVLIGKDITKKSRQSRERIEQLFSWDKWSKIYLDELGKICQEK